MSETVQIQPVGSADTFKKTFAYLKFSKIVLYAQGKLRSFLPGTGKNLSFYCTVKAQFM